jgi:hypothetical protein
MGDLARARYTNTYRSHLCRRLWEGARNTSSISSCSAGQQPAVLRQGTSGRRMSGATR